MDNVKYLRIRFSDSVIIRLQSYRIFNDYFHSV